MDFFKESIPPLLPAQWCQVFFSLAAAGILAVVALPSRLSRLMLGYGPRSSGSHPRTSRPSEWLEVTVSRLTAWGQVPHWWFATFYATSVACSAFWACQYLTNGGIIQRIASNQYPTQSRPDSQPGRQSAQAVFVAWELMALQGTRRLYEQLRVARKSSSTMWVVHWLLGTAFYICMSIAVWIEGAASILARQSVSSIVQIPSVKLVLGTMGFVIGSVAQYRCHKYLASLPKYSLPTEGLFRHLVCPHYMCECLLYLSLALAAAPEGQLLNRTLLSALLFVALNLGATAHGTRRWYTDKFGSESVAGRWTMIPLVY